MSDFEKNLDELVAAALKEDVGDGDRTTTYLVEKGLKALRELHV
jgi:nicotinate-nucleotide pyrophosphorylase